MRLHVPRAEQLDYRIDFFPPVGLGERALVRRSNELARQLHGLSFTDNYVTVNIYQE